MSTPIIENIAENIKTAINEITVANGYNQTLTCIRPRRNDFSDVSPDDLVVLLVQEGEEKDPTVISAETWMQTFSAMAMVIDSDKATVSIDTRINQVRADITKKLMVDAKRGNYAIDTIMLGSDKFDDGEGFTGIAVKFAVKYRTKYEDPYTQG